MKKFFVIAIIGLLSLGVYANQSVPTVVVKSFQSKFPNGQKAEWGQEDQNSWEVEFTINGEEFSACFNNSGKWLETEQELSKKDLPAKVVDKLQEKFKDYEIEEVDHCQAPDFKGYEIGIEKDETEMEVLVSDAGKLTIKNQKSEKEDNDNEMEKNEDLGDEDEED